MEFLYGVGGDNIMAEIIPKWIKEKLIIFTTKAYIFSSLSNITNDYIVGIIVG